MDICIISREILNLISNISAILCSLRSRVWYSDYGKIKVDKNQIPSGFTTQKETASCNQMELTYVVPLCFQIGEILIISRALEVPAMLRIVKECIVYRKPFLTHEFSTFQEEEFPKMTVLKDLATKDI